jgi:hypothetical protein
MKSIYSITFLKIVALTIAVVAVSVCPAHAQATEGKFTLAHDVHWGNTIVPAGDYSFTINSSNSYGIPSLLTLRKSNGKVIAMISPTASSKTHYSENAELVLTREGEERFVSSLYLGELGIVLNYPQPPAAINAPSQGQ